MADIQTGSAATLARDLSKRIGHVTWKQSIRRDWALYLILLVPIIITIIFKYLPMFGLIVAFKDYKIYQGFFGSEWVGLQWFRQILTMPKFYQLLRNTILLSVYTLIFAFPLPILLAILLNEIRGNGFKRIVQTTSYLPHFLSTVVAIGMMSQLLNPETGFVNRLLGGLGIDPIAFMIDPNWFRPLYVSLVAWQTTGYSSIIYLAALSAIDPQLYDAATVDGCGRFRQMRHVTLPGIAPTIVILFILQIGGLLSVGFEQVLLLYHPLTYEVADVIDTYVYRRGLVAFDLSFATTVGMFKSVVALVLVTAANKISKTISETALW